MIATLIVLAKRPVAGSVKTRLVPPLTTEQAAELAAAALRDTLRAVACTPARHRILAFDGSTTGWLPPGWVAARQPQGGLDVRMAAAFTAAAAGDPRPCPVLLVGMDTPQLAPDHLTAFDPQHYDACLGLAPDGGYWALGLRNPRLARTAILGVPMSTAHTGTVQLERLRACGLRVQLLESLVDVDTFADACQVGALSPETEFARTLAALRVPIRMRAVS